MITKDIEIWRKANDFVACFPLVAVVASDDDLSLLSVVWLFGCVLNSDDSDDRVTEINICLGVVFCFVVTAGKTSFLVKTFHTVLTFNNIHPKHGTTTVPRQAVREKASMLISQLNGPGIYLY
jgi:hypothetical protein